MTRRTPSEVIAGHFYTLYERHGRPPTVREMADSMGISSSHTAHEKMRRCAREGHIVDVNADLPEGAKRRVPAFWPKRSRSEGRVAAVTQECERVPPESPEYGLARRILHILRDEAHRIHEEASHLIHEETQRLRTSPPHEEYADA